MLTLLKFGLGIFILITWFMFREMVWFIMAIIVAVWWAKQ